MKLVSLARKYGDFDKPPEGTDRDEYYPSQHFDEKQLDALGVGSARVGDEMTMVATVRVESMSESKNGHRSMSFEIVEAGMKPKEADKNTASVLYPNG